MGLDVPSTPVGPVGGQHGGANHAAAQIKLQSVGAQN